MTQISPTGAGVSLRELLAHDAHGASVPELRATSCTSDWRHVRPGDVFVAITDADSDGHDHALEAVERGAVAVICERQLPVFNVPQCVVSDSRAVLGRLCQALVGNPSRSVKVIGVTGTHGKSTVTRLLASILRTAGGSVGTLDSFGYWDGANDRPPIGAPLSPPMLARSLAEMAAAGSSHAIVEFSSRELCQQTLAGVSLDAACVTYLGKHHLDWHGSAENYRQAKLRIFEHLSSHGVAVLNADDPVSVRALSELHQPALTFGMKNQAEVSAQVIEQYVNEQTFVLTAGDDSVGVRTSMIGDHHIYNCLAAATVALAYGVDLRLIARGLEAVDGLPGRMQRVLCGQNFPVFVDAADSSDSLRACLRAARQVTTGRVICVLGANADRESSDWPAMGRVAGALADVTVVTNNSLDETSHAACIAVHGGFTDRRKARVVIDRAQAIEHALAQADATDTVVVTGLGIGEYGPPTDDDTPVNDALMIRQLLHEKTLVAAQHRAAA